MTLPLVRDDRLPGQLLGQEQQRPMGLVDKVFRKRQGEAMTDLITRLRQSLTSITKHAHAAISAIEQESDEALGQIDATHHSFESW
jgi:hypothetical protein